MRLERKNFQVVIHTQGTVRARTESALIPEVLGRVEAISPAFRNGGFFEKGETLLQIEESDYWTTLAGAEANLAKAQLRLAEEKARADQARKDWEKLGKGEVAGSLVLRLPQMVEARAAVASAKAKMEEAKRDLERTKIRAPYAGRVLKQLADVGQYVSPGTILARIYAVDYAEVRLPLTSKDVGFIDLPELYRGEDVHLKQTTPPVTLVSQFGGKENQWLGHVVRTEGSIDVQSRQLFVVAQVDDPYGRRSIERPPLRVGTYVEAVIEGKLLKDVIVVPRAAVRNSNEVLLIDKKNKLRLQTLSILWSDRDHVVVQEGLEEGDLLCLTPIAFATEGAPVVPIIIGTTHPPEEMGMAIGEPSSGSESDRWNGEEWISPRAIHDSKAPLEAAEAMATSGHSVSENTPDHDIGKEVP